MNRQKLAMMFGEAASVWSGLADNTASGITAGEFRDKARECENIAALLGV